MPDAHIIGGGVDARHTEAQNVDTGHPDTQNVEAGHPEAQNVEASHLEAQNVDAKQRWTLLLTGAPPLVDYVRANTVPVQL